MADITIPREAEEAAAKKVARVGVINILPGHSQTNSQTEKEAGKTIV